MLGPFFRSPFCSSKAGATFRLAMISIDSDLKPRASQRCRNNSLKLEMEKWTPALFLGEPRPPPPPWCARGAGGVERSHGLKLNYDIIVLYIILRIYGGVPDRDCKRTVQINRDLFRNSPRRCPHRGQVGPIGQEHARRSQSRARTGRKGASLRVLEPAIEPAG